jgi:hypothetical protein
MPEVEHVCRVAATGWVFLTALGMSFGVTLALCAVGWFITKDW